MVLSQKAFRIVDVSAWLMVIAAFAIGLSGVAAGSPSIALGASAAIVVGGSVIIFLERQGYENSIWQKFTAPNDNGKEWR